MEYNLSLNEIIGRYFAMLLLVIIGGVMHSLLFMLIGMPFFITGLLGWCPVYQVLHINHAVKTDKEEG